MASDSKTDGKKARGQGSGKASKQRPGRGEKRSKKSAATSPEAARSDDDADDVIVVYERTKWWEDFRDFYFSFDRRTLGLARIFIGVFLLFDLFRRTADWFWMYANDGVLPTHYNLWRPQANGYTFFNAFATREELVGLWLLGFFIYVFYLVGYKTRVMQVLAAVYVASMNGRVLLIENGGYVVHNLLMLWTAFLPLGDRFSLDALAKSLRTQRETGDADLNDRSLDVAQWRLKPHVTFVGLIILLQLCAIYAFNVVHKTGIAWHNGTAVHPVLYVDRMVTPLMAHVRDHIPDFMIIILTKSVMGMEAGMSLALLSPLARVWAKRIAVLFVNLLHLGFGSTFVLGPFAWALCCFSTLLFSKEDWELAERTMKRQHRRRTVHYDPRSPAAFFWCRLLKRLDRFELLTFAADPATGSQRLRGLEVSIPDAARPGGGAYRRRPEGATARRRDVDAWADILCALPGGPIVGGPMRLPGFAQLAGLLLWAGWSFESFFWSKDHLRRYDPAAAPAGYRPELEDDPNHPTVDAYFMGSWLRDFYKTRILRVYQPLLGGITVCLGIFVSLYLGELLKRKLDISVREIVFGSGESAWTREDLLFWGGLGMIALGGFVAARPFVIMNLTTPSPPRRKWRRVVTVFRELTIAAFAMGALNQALVELWVFSKYHLPQPSVIRYLSHKGRYLQGWFMFSPNPVMDDGTIVVDAVTVDGRRIDPFSIHYPPYELSLPNFDLLHAKSFNYNQIWSDYFNRMHMGGNTSYRKPMKEFIFRLPERTGNPDDAVVKGAVYWVHDMNPRFPRKGGRQTESYGYNRKELFTFTNPDGEVQKRWRDLGAKEPPPAPLPVPLEENKEESPSMRKVGG